MWIYLSPHLDDAVYSCGGMIWEQTQAGEPVEVWTIFAGDARLPLSDYAAGLHERWQTGSDASRARRAEDLQACARLAAAARHFHWSDCIYRRLPSSGEPVVTTDEALFQHPLREEAYLVAEITARLAEDLPPGAQLAAPMTLGGHMDHHIVRQAAGQAGLPLFLYADFPYSASAAAGSSAYASGQHSAVSAAGLLAWQDAAACYRSQVSSFWRDESAMRAALQQYWLEGGGQRLFEPGG